MKRIVYDQKKLQHWVDNERDTFISRRHSLQCALDLRGCRGVATAGRGYGKQSCDAAQAHFQSRFRCKIIVRRARRSNSRRRTRSSAACSTRGSKARNCSANPSASNPNGESRCRPGGNALHDGATVSEVYQGTGPSSSKKPPVGPSCGRVARRTISVAACATVRGPLFWFRSVAV